jgi:D-alanine-D-alanine ligase
MTDTPKPITPVPVTVLAGGPSAEREVSLRSGQAVAQALRSLGHAVTELDPREPGWILPAGTRAVFLVLHGTYGEDGTVQDALEKTGVPYTGCGPEASRIAFDKALTKDRCVAAGVPTAPFRVLRRADEPWPVGWQPPVVLKPVRQGSSIGLQFVDTREAWGEAVRAAFAFDSEVLVEERVFGRELTVGILGGQVLPVVEIRPRQGAYDYHNKYTSGATEYFCPAPLAPEVAARVQQAAWEVFQAVGGRDYARVDVLLRENGQPVVLEVNTLPGMTETSLLPKAAAAAGLGYPQLCQRMLELALGRLSAGKPGAADTLRKASHGMV